MEQAYPSNDKFLGKIDLVESLVKEIEIQEALRIFQVDESIFLLGSSGIQQYDMTSLEQTRQIPLTEEQAQSVELSRNAEVINTTAADKIYTVANLSKFREEIPKQAWSLCL